MRFPPDYTVAFHRFFVFRCFFSLQLFVLSLRFFVLSLQFFVFRFGFFVFFFHFVCSLQVFVFFSSSFRYHASTMQWRSQRAGHEPHPLCLLKGSLLCSGAHFIGSEQEMLIAR